MLTGKTRRGYVDKPVSVWDIVNVDEIRGWEFDRIELKDGNLTVHGFRRTVERRPPSKRVNAIHYSS